MQVSVLHESRTFNSIRFSQMFTHKTGIFHTTFDNLTVTFLFFSLFLAIPLPILLTRRNLWTVCCWSVAGYRWAIFWGSPRKIQKIVSDVNNRKMFCFFISSLLMSVSTRFQPEDHLWCANTVLWNYTIFPEISISGFLRRLSRTSFWKTETSICCLWTRIDPLLVPRIFVHLTLLLLKCNSRTVAYMYSRSESIFWSHCLYHECSAKTMEMSNIA